MKTRFLELRDSSLFHYSNRSSYQLFQSLLASSEINLMERLLDQYELNMITSRSITTSSSSDDAMTSTLLHTRFASPNSGHIAQILRCLREHTSTFENYASFFQLDAEHAVDESTSVLEIRWQTALDYLNEEEKKWSAMHHNNRYRTDSFCLSPSTNMMNHLQHSNSVFDSYEANQRRQTFHLRSLASSDAPYMDDDDDEGNV